MKGIDLAKHVQVHPPVAWKAGSQSSRLSIRKKKKSVPVLLSRRWNDDWNAGNNRVFSDSQKYLKKSRPEKFRFPIFVLIWRYIFHEYPAKCVAWILLPTFFSDCQRDALKNFFLFISLRWHLKDEWHPTQFEIEKNPLLFSLAR